MSIKKRNKIILIIVLICVIVGGLTIVYLEKTKPYISDDKLIIYTGYTKTIFLHGRTDKIIWSSDNENVAIVNNGSITAISEGNASIFVETDKTIFKCEVIVRQSHSKEYYDFCQQEKDWVLSQQLDNGAICNRVSSKGTVSINPYFACMSMINVLNTNVSESDIEKVNKYINWHFEHLNDEEDYNGLIGTIYDYHAKVDGNHVLDEENLESYDSTDSYAALFLVLLKDYAKKSGDIDLLKEHREDIELVTNAMFSTYENGFTLSKPDYRLYYLMDNVEVYLGIKAVLWMYEEAWQDYDDLYLNLQSVKQYYNNNFEKIWWSDKHYTPYIGEDMRINNDFSWDIFYPDATSQVSVILYEFGNKEYHKNLYESFCDSWNWQDLDFYNNGTASFYWGELLYAAAVMKDEGRAVKYIESYKKVSSNREYPLIVSDCSWVMRGSYKLATYYEEIEKSFAD